MKTVLSFGMGVESSALLLRWLEEPQSRGFDLESDLDRHYLSNRRRVSGYKKAV